MLHIQKPRAHTQGMTFIEVIVVLLVVGILMGLIVPGAMRWVSTAKRNKTEILLKGIKTQLIQFQSDTGQYPNTLRDLMTRPSDPKVAQRWKGPYLEDE